MSLPTRRRVLLPLVALALAGTFIGCGSATVVLWTDKPEAAPVVELFNAEQDRYVVELRYEPDVSRALRLSETSADVVIAEAIEDASTARLFRPVDRLLGNTIDPDDNDGAYYPDDNDSTENNFGIEGVV